MALSAPVAKALRIVASVLASPTVITVTEPFPPSAKSMAFDKAISSYGFTIYCTPTLLKAVLSFVNVILEVVSGTLLIHTNIFIIYNRFIQTYYYLS
ncbi:hypothetical protein D3C87_1201750 [compost metagenome]